MISQFQRLPLCLKSVQALNQQPKRQALNSDTITTKHTLKALFVSAGMAMAAPLICSCMILDWSAPVVVSKMFFKIFIITFYTEKTHSTVTDLAEITIILAQN